MAVDTIQVKRVSGDLDITRFIDVNTFRKQDNLTNEADVCTFTVRKYGSRTYVPAVGDEMEVWHQSIKIFGGTIVKIVKKLEGANIVLYDCTLKDYTQTLDRKLVAKEYTNQSPEAIITDIKNTYLTGFTVTNVPVTGITVEYIYFDYVLPSRALQQLAELIGYDWYVDYDKDIHFFKTTDGEVAPFSITDANGNCITGSLEIQEDNSQVRNTIYVRGGEYVGDSRSDKVGVGDGVQKAFPLPYRYDTAPSVTVGGVAQTVGVDYLDSEDSFDCLWNYQEKVIKFKVAPASGNVVVTGTPMIVVLVKAQDNASVLANGTYEFRIVDKTIKTKAAARRRAQAEMADYASNLREAGFQTYTAGLRSGMKVTINSTVLNENRSYIINRVSVMMFDRNTFIYEVSLVTTRTMGIIAYLQKQIADSDRKIGVIKQEGVVIDTISDIQGIDSVSMSESLIYAGLNDPPIWVAGPYSPTV